MPKAPAESSVVCWTAKVAVEVTAKGTARAVSFMFEVSILAQTRHL